MRKLNQSQLESFINQNIMLSGTRERPGLMLTTANEIVKPFYRRKFISSRTFLPQAKRFAANSWKLLEKKIPAPVVKEVIYCPDYPVHMVVYNRIDGRDLRELCAEQGNDLISLVPAYLAELHRLGFFFRALHLGNLIYDGERLHMVDISDLQVRNHPLTLSQRARNLAHLFNSRLDKSSFLEYGIARFNSEYEATQNFNSLQRQIFRRRLYWSLFDDMKEYQHVLTE